MMEDQSPLHLKYQIILMKVLVLNQLHESHLLTKETFTH